MKVASSLLLLALCGLVTAHPLVLEQHQQLKNVVCPGGQTECPDGNTCCQLSSGQYGCCPLPQAVCCSDHLHCCPTGYTCDVSAGTCTKEDDVIPFVKKTPAKYNIICPDGQSQCPDGNTCCQLSSGQYGCCPLPNAVCCSDHEHCCPQGSTCDVSKGTCTQEGEVIPFVKKTPAKYKNIVCPDGQSECPDGNTCCKLSSGQWGCCPLPNAVCCSDGVHCCPEGYTCDVSAGTCTKGDDVIPFVKKTPAKYNIICPDGQSQCPDGNTCCQLSSGQYGCCPLPNAVCCSDHEHCCPQGSTCDVSKGTCTQEGEVIPFVKKTPAKYKNVVCPDGQSECPDGDTCCKLSSGQWGCCPLPNAVCCSDGVHCCPEGYTCDVSAGTCTKGDDVIPFVKKTPAKYKNVVCPDGQSECPDGETCCLSYGEYGCCPYPYAVCCSDGVHCCPEGYQCVVSGGTCTKGDDVIPFVKKTPAKYKSVVCPDGQSECPDGNTCCKLSSGQWGCCPLPNAVCCSDHLHCCPQGSTCDVSAGTCTQEGEVIPFVKKTPAKYKIVVCPGSLSYCPDGNTCCQLPSGLWGCCPFPNAVCCSGGRYCCPQGNTCDAGGCNSQNDVLPFFKKLPAARRAL